MCVFFSGFGCLERGVEDLFIAGVQIPRHSMCGRVSLSLGSGRIPSALCKQANPKPEKREEREGEGEGEGEGGGGGGGEGEGEGALSECT